MKVENIDDFILWVTLGIILGGRSGYVLFYNLPHFIGHPLEIVIRLEKRMRAKLHARANALELDDAAVPSFGFDRSPSGARDPHAADLHRPAAGSCGPGDHFSEPIANQAGQQVGCEAVYAHQRHRGEATRGVQE